MSFEDPHKDLNIQEEGTEEVEEEEFEEDAGCFGEYGLSPLCEECRYKKQCKAMQEAEKNISHRYKGKYVERGKEIGSDRY